MLQMKDVYGTYMIDEILHSIPHNISCNILQELYTVHRYLAIRSSYLLLKLQFVSSTQSALYADTNTNIKLGHLSALINKYQTERSYQILINLRTRTIMIIVAIES